MAGFHITKAPWILAYILRLLMRKMKKNFFIGRLCAVGAEKILPKNSEDIW